MNIAQIEKNLSELVKNISLDEFVYDILLAYGTPKTTFTLLKKGNSHLSQKDGQIILKRKLFFQETQEQDLHGLIYSLKNDDLGLLNVKPKKSAVLTADERLIASFTPINQFIAENGRDPESGKGVQEHQLYARLDGIRGSAKKMAALASLDEHDLLNVQRKEISSIDDIFYDDDLGILGNEAESIFTLKHISKETTMPDYVASRKPCKDFEIFEAKFIQCQADLAADKRKLWTFKNEQQIQKGYFFVLKGVLLYVADVGEVEKSNGKKNDRLRCIFENGTESDILLRSLAA